MVAYEQAIKITASGLTQLSELIHNANVEKGWWDAGKDPNVIGTKIALIHSEVSEALEGYRKDLMDTHIPHRKMVEVELADTLVRLVDLAGALGLDLTGAFVEKVMYNTRRADHLRENREKLGGKKI